MKQKGTIGVTTENIFPVIKKFLYSDHEIFLREIVSNAVDATQKLKTLASKGEFKGEIGDATVRVKVDKKTITVSDNGIGMTEEDQANLYTKFQRFDMEKNVNIAGTGLGMAITKGLIDLLGGSISVKSTYGEGSTFLINIEPNNIPIRATGIIKPTKYFLKNPFAFFTFSFKVGK